MTPSTVAIVGAGLAGARAAGVLRAEGFEGRIVLFGDEPVGPYERPALSKEYLAGTRDEASLLLRSPEAWERQAVELRLSTRVASVDPVARRLTTAGGEQLRFDELVLATGARPRRLPLERPDGVHELRTLADARRLRADLAPGARLVVIGGGFVGAEVASTARALGVVVTIVEAAPAPVARVLGTEVGLALADRWRGYGVDVRLGVGVAHFRADAAGCVSSVLLTDGSTLRADVVVVGVGVEPAAELLPPRPALHVRTAGDLSGPGHWTAAFTSGAAAARGLLGLPVPPDPPAYVWSDQFDLRLQVVGTPRPNDHVVFDGSGEAFTVAYVDAAGATRAGVFANRPDEAAALRRRLAEPEAALAA
jgi:3-phenylpropionate/trans-cinnamate dioxygenase ferredoxin reductase component